MMGYYLAPMEGVTGYIYRNAYHSVFEPADKYFTPFIATNQNQKLRTRDLKDVLPEHNQGLTIVPQILSNCAADFLLLAKRLQQLGYQEINLNLGCPSGTVVAKKKGSGFLAFPAELDRFLEAVCADLPEGMGLSVKTRIGKEDPDEMVRLLKIYNQYPLTELIVHPRIQTDYYKNKPNLEVFEEILVKSRIPVCYNGDIRSVDDCSRFEERFPQTENIMLGRGVIADPSLIGRLKARAEGGGNTGGPVLRERLMVFHDCLYRGYQEEMSGDRNVLFKMKEVWSYLIASVPDAAKDWKRIRKAVTAAAYEEAIALLFEKKEWTAGLEKES